MPHTRIAIALFVTLVATCQYVQSARPNVVILFTDDQGTLDANCFGSRDLQTPNIDRLAKTGLRDNTILLFQSDNGQSAESYAIKIDKHNSGYPKGHNSGANGGGGNTGKWIGHKGTFLEGGIRTPAVISYPARLPQGVVRDQAVTVMDWFPTILDLCGIDRPAVKLDGHSVLPLIKDASAPSAHKILHFMWQENWAVREGDWKLIRHKPNKDGTEVRTLHNLSEPRPEVRDHAADRPELVKHLQTLHDEYANGVFADQKEPRVTRDPKRKLDL